MKAVLMRRTGGPEVLEFVDLPEPRPGAGEVRVRAEAIGVGKPDVLIRTGVYAWMPALPAIPGNEMVGVVDALGPGAQGVELGQRVLVSARELATRGGCYAQRICVPAQALFVLPASMDPLRAAGLGNYQLALAMLFDSGCAPARSMLVQAAAGGVGIALVQVAAAHGIEVIAVAGSADKCAFARAAGAHHVHRRGEADLLQAVRRITGGRGVDLVLDHVGGSGFASQLDLLSPRGTLLSYNVLAGLPQENMVQELRKRVERGLAIRCYSIHMLDHEPQRRRELMNAAIALLADGRVRPPAPTVLPLQEAAQAHRLLDSPSLMGKVVLVP